MAKITTIQTEDSNLPVSVPVKIVRGNTFRSPIYRHPNGDGTYQDTSGWDITPKIFESQACGAAELAEQPTIEHQPGPEFGYRMLYTPTQTEGLTCADNWYTILTDDGATKRTYFAGPAKITGVGP